MFNLTITVEEKEDGHGNKIYVASCLQVEDITAEGATAEEAQQNLSTALHLWMTTTPPQEVLSKIGLQTPPMAP